MFFAAGYVFFLAPNQTPTIDAFTVQKLVGLKQEDPFQVACSMCVCVCVCACACACACACV